MRLSRVDAAPEKPREQHRPEGRVVVVGDLHRVVGDLPEVQEQVAGQHGGGGEHVDVDHDAAGEVSDRVREQATLKGCTPSQLALAWVHSQGEDVFPIPGTKSSARIAEHAHAIQVLDSLSAEDVKRIADCAAALEGGRYPETMNGRTFNSRV